MPAAEDLSAGMVELHLRGRVAAGRRDDLVAFLAEAIPFYERPGGIKVRLLWDVADPDRFIEAVEYLDQGTYDRDQIRAAEDPEMVEYLRRWRALLTGPAQVETYSQGVGSGRTGRRTECVRFE